MFDVVEMSSGSVVASYADPGQAASAAESEMAMSRSDEAFVVVPAAGEWCGSEE